MIAFKKTNELGFQPVFLTNDPSRYAGIEKQSVTIIQCNTSKLSDLKNIIQSYSNEIVGITTTSEFYIETVAELNEYFGFEGNQSNIVKNVRNKSTVRNILKRVSALYQPNYLIVEKNKELINKNIPYPCIVKPVDDSGSNLVKKCNTYTEIKEHIRMIESVIYNSRGQETSQFILIEEFIGGQEYSVECFSYMGNHEIIGVTKKTVGEEPYFVEFEHIFPAFLSQQQLKTIEQGILLILDTLEWQTGPTHIEVKIWKGKLFLVEFNGRLAGGMIPELIRYATGTDLLEEQLKVAIGLPPVISKKINQTAGIRHILAKEKGRICFTEVDGLMGFLEVKQWKINVQEGDFVKKAENAYDRIGHIIAVGKDHLEVESTLEKGEEALGIKIKKEMDVS